MTAILTSLHCSVIIFVGAFLFTGVGWLEPNRRFAIILKCAILAAGGIAIARQCCLEGSPLGRMDMAASKLYIVCVAPLRRAEAMAFGGRGPSSGPPLRIASAPQRNAEQTNN